MIKKQVQKQMEPIYPFLRTCFVVIVVDRSMKNYIVACVLFYDTD